MSKLHRCTFQNPESGYWVAARYENRVVTLEPFEEDREIDPEEYRRCRTWCELHSPRECADVDAADRYLWSLGLDPGEVGFD